MKVDREALLAAVEAASLIVDPKHSIEIFSKVWLFEDYVLGFNASGMVVQIPCEIPSIGGVEGKLLAQLLAKIESEEVEISPTENGQALITDGENIHVHLPVLEEIDVVHTVSEVPDLDVRRLVECDVSVFLDEISIPAMLQLAAVKFDPTPEFSSFVIDIKAADSSNNTPAATIYTSDRQTINRTVYKSWEVTAPPGRYLIPIEFIKTLLKLYETFKEGTLTFDAEYIVATTEEGAGLFTRLNKSDTNVDFEEAVLRIWPDRKIKPKSMVEIPPEFKVILNQAKLVCKTDNDIVRLSVNDGLLTVTAEGAGRARYSASLDFDHPPTTVSLNCTQLIQVLPHADKMLLLHNAAAFRGPNKFWRFIAGRA